jgi:pyrimidine operon attenuation protein / uracil phosphoribosyltransferase
VPKKYILNEQQADLKIRRMALEILENYPNNGQIVLAGIVPNGTIIAKKLKNLLQPHLSQDVLLQDIHLDKRHPVNIEVSPVVPTDDKVVILVDDVANSGRTLTYALKPYLEGHPKSIHTLVLVDRTHKQFPIHADYVGFSLASTLQEYIDLDVENGEIKGAWME